MSPYLQMGASSFFVVDENNKVVTHTNYYMTWDEKFSKLKQLINKNSEVFFTLYFGSPQSLKSPSRKKTNTLIMAECKTHALVSRYG